MRFLKEYTEYANKAITIKITPRVRTCSIRFVFPQSRPGVESITLYLKITWEKFKENYPTVIQKLIERGFQEHTKPQILKPVVESE